MNNSVIPLHKDLLDAPDLSLYSNGYGVLCGTFLHPLYPGMNA